ncbi:aminoglycoside phosphotransferase family protein [Streptomyces sp. KK5PA1]|uniref:Aminoglycoside phosphotransferase family protein n=2 Tax=Actinacidiphila acididurans TaxID=2784346 RepID=A0ABS2U018_9ACTN|nr:aminoglycoside phosphotransferase family protein [Actinacidiphila acididurans]
MHPGTHPVDDHLVRRLVAAQFPQWAQLPVTRWPSGGTVNAMYRLGDAMVVRLPLLAGGAADVAAEQKWLPRLAPLLPTAVPHVLGAGRPAEGCPWPWSVYRWLPGEHPRAGALTEPVRLAQDLAEFVTAMRGITLPGAPRAYRGGSLALLDASTRAAIEQLRALPEENVDGDAVSAVWDQALRTAGPNEPPPVWLHADLMPGNLLITDGRLSSVIDFGCMGTGDPACDLFPAWNLLPPHARAVFRALLDVDDPTWLRARARTLSHALIALPYYRTTNPPMATNARHVIHAVLEEV